MNTPVTDDYLAPTLPDPLPANPLAWAHAWLEHATAEGVQRNPNSMMLATVAGDGQPSARVVLCKSFVVDPGYLVFYTNYQSRKMAEAFEHPDVAATFHWDALGRQVRIEGIAVRSPADESDAYFATRHWGSQVGAWGSDQSAPIASRAALIAQVAARARSIGVEVADDLQTLAGSKPESVPRPKHWGGVRIWPRRVELWIEGGDRIHDRAAWVRSLTAGNGHAFEVGEWSATRLQP